MREVKERPEFYAFPASLMQCEPGNMQHGEGEPCAILTLSKPDMSIEAQFYRLDDARDLVTKLLVVLMTYEDTLAQQLLYEHFVSDQDGQFAWPEFT